MLYMYESIPSTMVQVDTTVSRCAHPLNDVVGYKNKYQVGVISAF